MAESEQQKASKDDTISIPANEVSLEGWLTRVEDLLDKDDEDGAVKLLESIMAKLSVLAENDNSNLALAATMSDLAGLYAVQGMSIKADQLLSDALLIKNRTEEGATSEADHLS